MYHQTWYLYGAGVQDQNLLHVFNYVHFCLCHLCGYVYMQANDLEAKKKRHCLLELEL